MSGSPRVSAPHATVAPSLAATIRKHTGLAAARCYQCGKCSAGCPMAAELTFKPHDLVRLVQRDEGPRIFADPSIWLCLTCETCSARCPNDVDPARIIDALRELALQADPESAPRAVRAFHKAFLKQIRRSGRIFEFGLVAGFKMRSGKLFADVHTVPGMLRRGKLALAPHRIRGVRDVRRIMQACQPAGEEA